MSTLLATALAFAKHGHPVLPLHYPVGTDKLVWVRSDESCALCCLIRFSACPRAQ
jgi:hypothetical protein